MINIKNPERMEEMVDRLFPNRKRYPVNSATPAIVERNGVHRLAMLVVVDEQAEEMLWASEHVPEIIGSAQTRPNRYGIGFDLVLRFHAVCSTGAILFETIIPGDEVRAQQRVVDVISQPCEVGFFVLAPDHELMDILKAQLHPDDLREALDTLFQQNT